MRLSKNFTLAEFEITSQPFDNVPGPAEIANIQLLVDTVLQPLRYVVGPLLITSGYRSPEVNKAVGGVDTSYHVQGLACDMVSGTLTPLELLHRIKEMNLPVDKAIAEFSEWVHVQVRKSDNRGEYLIASKESGKTVYSFA